MEKFRIRDKIAIYHADAMSLYDRWDKPTVIISDGPYGVNSFPGDLYSYKGLAEWYEPHIIKWSEKSTPQTTLWFWNTEIGWATVHPILEMNGWSYRACNIWDKGVAHIAGNCNTKTLRRLPVVSEVCAQYVKKALVRDNGRAMDLKAWLRYEWERTGLPFSKTNKACGVKDAATRKYFTRCHLWYFPPAEAFEKIADYANKFGKPNGKPYFSFNGKRPLTAKDWEKQRAKFSCVVGVTNVWREPAVRGQERIKKGSKAIHTNQKSLKLTELIIKLSSNEGDIVWEPFGGLCTGATAAHNLRRRCFSAEIRKDYYATAVYRIKSALKRVRLSY